MIDETKLLEWIEENITEIITEFENEENWISLEKIKSKILSMQKEGIDLVKYKCVDCEHEFYIEKNKVTKKDNHILIQVEGNFYLVEGKEIP